jgi:hypothetical protein
MQLVEYEPVTLQNLEMQELKEPNQKNVLVIGEGSGQSSHIIILVISLLLL